MDELFSIYSASIPVVSAWAAQEFPIAAGDSPAAHERAIRAKALDLLRGLLPAASLSHMGIFASGQTYEQLIMHLLAHPLPEARTYGELLLTEVQAVIPSFVARVPRPERGGEWIEHLRERGRAGDRWAARLDLGPDRENAPPGPSVTLTHVDGTEEDLLCALLFESAGTSEQSTREAVRALSSEEQARMLSDLVGERANRRHRPGRGFEALRYRFEIVADYGAFRDLQRHRMLTVQWQTLTPDLGADVPGQVELAGAGDEYRRALELSRDAYERIRDQGLAERRALRAVPRVPAAVRARPQRPRGDAADRAALRARGSPQLPGRRSRDARADRRRAPGGGGDVHPRRPRDRAAAGADPVRDAQPGGRRDARWCRSAPDRPDRGRRDRARRRRLRRLGPQQHDAGPRPPPYPATFVARSTNTKAPGIAVFSSRTGKPLRRLTDNPRDIDPLLTRDQRWVYFVRVPQDPCPVQLERVPSTGGAAQRLAPAGYPGGPVAISQDGRMLAYISTGTSCRLDAAADTLVLVDLATGQVHRISAVTWGMAWSPDDRTLAFVGPDPSTGRSVIKLVSQPMSAGPGTDPCRAVDPVPDRRPVRGDLADVRRPGRAVLHRDDQPRAGRSLLAEPLS